MKDWHVRLRLKESLFNKIVSAMETQRPSLFNYATERLAKSNETCSYVADTRSGASKFTLITPLVLGQNSRMRLLADYCYQIRNLKFDFSPLDSGKNGQFELSANIFVGLGLPENLSYSDMLLPYSPLNTGFDNFIDYKEIACYQSTLIAQGEMRFINHYGKWLLLMQLNKFSLNSSDGLYSMIEHYVRTTLNSVILPQAASLLTPLEFDAPDELPPKVSITLIPSESPNPIFSSNTLEIRLLTA